MIDYDDPSIVRIFEQAHTDGVGAEAVLRTIRDDMLAAEWAGWTTEQRQEFNRQTTDRFRVYSATEYAAARFEELRERDFPLWVFRCDPEVGDDRFAELNGVALSPSDPFWKTIFPLSLSDGGYVVGARSEAGVRRLGGDPEKSLPQWASAE